MRSITKERAVTAATRRRAIGANDRIRIGIIGCGDRGCNVHIKNFRKYAQETNIEVVALADPWRLAREKANGMVREEWGRDARLFSSYRGLLECENLDAVTIASLDFQHTTHLEAAAKAGKHIYCEKPWGVEFEPLKRAVDAARNAGTVIQAGTQIRSLPSSMGARTFFRSGLLGNISRIEERRNMTAPCWYSYLNRKKDLVREADVDWHEFLNGLPYRPFNVGLFAGWYGYYEFSRGPLSGFGPHYYDLIHSITGAKNPTSCVAQCMHSKTWRDEYNFTAPDMVEAVWTYPDGFIMTTSNNSANSSSSVRKIYGDKGSLDLTNWNKPIYDCNGAPKRDGSIRGVNEVPPVDHPEHFLDWLQCMRTGQTPNASVEDGFQHALCAIMATKSYETGRRTLYNAATREMTYS